MRRNSLSVFQITSATQKPLKVQTCVHRCGKSYDTECKSSKRLRSSRIRISKRINWARIAAGLI